MLKNIYFDVFMKMSVGDFNVINIFSVDSIVIEIGWILFTYSEGVWYTLKVINLNSWYEGNVLGGTKWGPRNRASDGCSVKTYLWHHDDVDISYVKTNYHILVPILV